MLAFPLRGADPTLDLGFIFGTWRDTFRESQWAGVVPNHLYRDTMDEMIRGLLTRGAKVMLATNPSDNSHLVGFICYETPLDHPPVLHYLFVKDAFRGYGAGKQLLERAGFRRDLAFHYTARTYLGSRRIKGGQFSPAIARRKEAPTAPRRPLPPSHKDPA